MAGLFISFEGTDGSGKSLQSSLLKDFLEKDFDVILLREPGSTNISEKIREIIIDKNNNEMHSITEAVLYTAARAQLVHQVILPSLEMGKVVICDRYVDSSYVYQGISRGLSVDFVKKLNEMAIGTLLPHVTFFLDIPLEVGLARVKTGEELDRLELEGKEFFEKVHKGYKSIWELDKNRIKIIDGTKDPLEVHKDIIKILKDFL